MNTAQTSLPSGAASAFCLMSSLCHRLPIRLTNVGPDNNGGSGPSHLPFYAVDFRILLTDLETRPILDRAYKKSSQIHSTESRMKRRLATLTKERNEAIAERNKAQETINGYLDDEDFSSEDEDAGPLSYCECCDSELPRSHVTWFGWARTHTDGRTVHSACGPCFNNLQPLDLQAIAANAQ